MDPYSRFRAGANSFLSQKLAFLKYHRFHFLNELCHCNEKLCFPFFASSFPLPIARLILFLQKSCTYSFYFGKNMLLSFFHPALKERQNSAASETLKAYRHSLSNLKSKTIISSGKITLTKPFCLTYLSCYEKHH